MVVVFAGILLGFIVLFFLLAFLTGWLVLLAPVLVLVVLAIQTFLRIRDRNA